VDKQWNQRFEEFIGQSMRITICGGEGEEIAPAVTKPLHHVGLCPDQTHIRLYFNELQFVAIPVDSEWSEASEQVTAYDTEGKLTYMIQKHLIGPVG
jgi:hypothetical protein